MNKEPITVGIAGRKEKTVNYENACLSVGLSPCTSLRLSQLISCDALLLPGGGDITPGFYGQENHSSHSIDTELDILQLQALDYFVRSKKPILGICKGMQLINIYFGGTLTQDLSERIRHQIAEGDVLHPSYVQEDCVLSRLYGSRFQINSNHHQAIDRLGKGLRVVQTSDDGIIEGITHDTLPIFAVQWHPERLADIRTKKASLSGNLLLHSVLAG